MNVNGRVESGTGIWTKKSFEGSLLDITESGLFCVDILLCYYKHISERNKKQKHKKYEKKRIFISNFVFFT